MKFASIVVLLAALVYAAYSNCSDRERLDSRLRTVLSGVADDEQVPANEAGPVRPAAVAGEQILVRTGYVVSYSSERLCPNWVAWHLTRAHADGTVERRNHFAEDEEVPWPRATLEDYRMSGFDRGHMCPAGDNKWSERAMDESFLLSNMCPQDASLNSGMWNALETDTRTAVAGQSAAYVVAGPVWMSDDTRSIGRNNVAVPAAFFKIVYFLTRGQCFAYLLENEKNAGKYYDYACTVADIEGATGLTFPDIPSDLKRHKAARTRMQWQM